ncbi:MAG: hypothetical protein AB7G37_03995 [Solirubrobacteraceae bacterium]
MRRTLALLPVMLVFMVGCGDDDGPKAERPAEAIPCPSEATPRLGADRTTPTPATGALDARDLLDLSVDEASDRAQGVGCTVRVVRRDGEDLPGTLDLRPNRINVEEQDGRVVRIQGVG